MNNYCMIQNSKTFAFSAENPTGVRAGDGFSIGKQYIISVAIVNFESGV